MARKATAKAPEMAQYGFLEYLSGRMAKFRATDYAAVQRAVKLSGIIDQALGEANKRKVEALGKFGIKPGETIKSDHPKFSEIAEAMDTIANSDSSVAISELQLFTAEQFEKDALGEGGLDYSEAGILGKWLIKNQ